MFTLNDDLSIYVTRGDTAFFSVTVDDDGKPYVFQAGDVVRFKVFGKKDAENVVLQKDFPVTAKTESVAILLTEDDTKIGDVISKHKDYWYEVELNPFTNPQTIIGYDEDGAKVFRLLPEGADVPEKQPIKPEDIPIVDDELDMTSTRPVENQAIARAIVQLQADYNETKETVLTVTEDTVAAVSVERARIDNIVASAVAPADADASYLEVADIRVGADGKTYASAGTAVREQMGAIKSEIRSNYAKTPNKVNKRTFKKGYLNSNNGSLMNSQTGADPFYDRFITTDYIQVNGGETYIFYNQIASAYTKILLYSDVSVIQSTFQPGTAKEYSLTIPTGVKYIRGSFDNQLAGNANKYSVDNPAFNSVVVAGEDVHSAMMGDIECEIKTNDNQQIMPEKICGFERLTNNMFNKYDVVNNKFLSNNLVWLDGETFSEYFTSGYIQVEPNSTYTLSPVWSVAYFTKQYMLIGYSEDVENRTLTVTVPDDCYYIRFRALMRNKDKVMMNSGSTSLPYEEYEATFGFMPEGKSEAVVVEKRNRMYTLKEALCRWYAGEKFPVGFFGDSTTDGMGTTAGGTHETLDANAGGWGLVDYINKDAYPYKLEQLLKEATRNNSLRIYNIGYTGHRFKSVMPHYDDIFGHAYADVKMVGIVFGINDRLTTDEKAYYDEYRYNLVQTVEYLYSKGIQPFMVTTQALVEPYCPTNLDVQYYPMRDGESVNTIANGIKREVAEEYGLEIIDMNAYGEFMMQYSQIPMDDICTDKTHFKNAGHTLESEYLYSVLCGRCAYVKKGDVLSFASQRVKSKVPSDYVKNYSGIHNGFKVYAEFERETSDDLVLQDFVVYVDEKTPATLTARCESVETQYVVVDDVKYNISDIEQDVCVLDVGVHRIKAASGNSHSVNWVGFKLR